MAGKRSSSRGRLNSRNNVDRGPFVRYAVWTTVICALLVAIFMSGIGIERLFFSANPHFTLRKVKVEVTKGHLNEDSINPMKLGLEERVTNLYAVNVRELRERLLADPTVEYAEVLRILPDTIKIRVAGRTPIAQLILRGGKTVDVNGCIMPPGIDSTTLNLPVILGVRDVVKAKYGDNLSDPMLRCALEFLAYKATLPSANMLEVGAVVCNHRDEELIVRLRGSARHGIRPGAQLHLPAADLRRSLHKAIESLQVRALARQQSGCIDATYDRVYITP